MEQRQFAIIDNSKCTVTIHPVSKDYIADGKDVYILKEFSLLDDSNMKCMPRVIFVKGSGQYWYEIKFITPGPPSYKYEISLYFFDSPNKLRYIGVEYVGAIQQNRQVKFDCSHAFQLTDNGEKYLHLIDNCVKLCSQIARKDNTFVLQQKPPLLYTAMTTDCSLLFENNALSSFKIIVKTKEFQVHKEILANKSPVFLAMFESEMKEKKDNVLIIKDIEPVVFKELLRYIYSNVVNDLETNAENLFMAADKYDIQNLQLLCADELIRSLNVENAMHILALFDKHNAGTLKEMTLNFVKTHIKLIIETEGYKEFCQQVHPQLLLLSDILKAVA